MTTFFKNLFSKNFWSAVGHLFDPRRDLGIWFYTNQWAGLNKLFHLAVKTGAFQNKKQALEWIWKALIATNVGYLVGWATKSGLLAAYEIILKPLYNMTVGNLSNFFCSLFKKMFPDLDCSKLYAEEKSFGGGMREAIEPALIQEFITDAVDVMNGQYSKYPVYSSVMRLFPVINYFDTWRYSMFAKGIEGVTGRKTIQNFYDFMNDPNPGDTVNVIKNDIKAAAPDSATAQAVDSIQINWDK